MQLISNHLEKYVFEEIEKCKNSIVIISPFLSDSTIKRLIDLVIEKDLRCTVVTRFERKAFIDGASSLEALKLLIEHDIPVLGLKNLHANVYIFDKHVCMLGSANFTKKALTENHELLMKLTETEEIEPVLNYADQLMNRIFAAGDWQITKKDIEIEQSIETAYHENKEENSILSYSLGAELKNISQKYFDPDQVVLSVLVGETHELVKTYFIHAHPDDQYHHYKQLDGLITFRQNHGGRMDAIYYIDDTFTLDDKNWEEELEELPFSKSIKNRIKMYINDRRNSDFGFEKPIPFKFYILTLVKELPHEPRPKANHSGARYYTFGSLSEGNELLP